MHDVFISYSSTNQKIADAVVSILENQRIKCWIAYRDAEAGDDYAVSIVRAIKKSKVCVLILCGDSNCSRHVLSEINSCVNYSVTVLPFKVADVALHEAIEYYLGKTHWLDAMTPPLEDHIIKLAERVRYFLNERGVASGDMTQKPGLPTKLNSSKANRFDTKMAKYEELVSLGYDAEKIAIQLVENDYINFYGIDEDNEGTAQQWEIFIQNSTETTQFLINGDDEIVGDWSILALNEKMFEEAKKGQLLEKDITFEKSEMIAFPDIYYGYVLSISILPDYRTMKNYMKLVNSFYEQLEVYAEHGIFFKEWCMNVFSSEIENIAKRLGFTYLCDNKKYGKIYHQHFMPLPKNPITAKFPRLIQLYDAMKETEDDV